MKKLYPGDIILVGSNKTGPKIVRFFMASPNMFVHFFRFITRKQEYVPFYHVAMVYNSKKIIEQQMKVGIKSSDKILNTSNNLFIFRYKGATKGDRELLKSIAEKDIGQKWDVLNAIGKFLTWLTAIPLFARYIEYPKQEICVCRTALWYRKVFNEKFGVKRHSELTTQKMYNYVKSNLDKFTIVHEKI